MSKLAVKCAEASGALAAKGAAMLHALRTRAAEQGSGGGGGGAAQTTRGAAAASTAAARPLKSRASSGTLTLVPLPRAAVRSALLVLVR